MKLVADPKTKGLWLPEAPRKAGAHAILIGVSDYPHLSGGSAPLPDLAPDNGGLGQLEVSAKTAAKVFHWLEQIGEVAGAPVATCRLLLSPRPGESAEIDLLTNRAYAPADFESVCKAIVDWGDDIFAGATEPGATSRSSSSPVTAPSTWPRRHCWRKTSSTRARPAAPAKP